MALVRSCLLLGGVASLLIVLLHLALVLRPRWYRHFDAGELAQLYEQGSRFTVLVTLGLALMFGLWSAYALSGAGVIGQLPLLRAVTHCHRRDLYPAQPHASIRAFQGIAKWIPLAFCRLFDRLVGSRAASPGRYICPI